ncbi:MAG: transporter protein [Candidatus Midichloriaceae bacterium]|nr:transporter protein [Candidatus Midichloriaceae bacterium]
MLSGLPLALTASTLSVLLRERGVDLATIGVFAMVGLPHTLKFLWAPILDNLKIYFLSEKLGRRRAQLLLISTLLYLSLAILGLSVNAEVQYIAVASIIIAFLSASQDTIIDAMRIEMLDDSEQAAGSSSATTGYRMAMIISSAGALSIAHFLGWELSYLSMAAIGFMLLAICVVFYQDIVAPIAYDTKLTFIEHFINTFSKPFIEIYNRTNFFHVIMFVVFFKMSDALILSLNSAFLLDVGFSKLDIAWAVKSFGMAATIIGALVGGYVATKINLKTFVVLGIILQMVSNLSYLLLVDTDGNISKLLLVTTIEYSCSGISTAALVAYISTLCNKQFTASQYSLLSAIASFARTTVAGSAGFMVESIGWSAFFIATALASLPSLLLVGKAFIKNIER